MMETKALEMDLLPVSRGTKSGDCIVVRYGNLTQGGKEQLVFVVDGGYLETKEVLKGHLSKYYNCKDHNGKYVIDKMFLSHPDQDHIEGLVEIMKDDEFVVHELITMIPWKVMSLSWFRDGRITKSSLQDRLVSAFSLLKELIDLAERKNVTIVQPTDLIMKKYKGATFITLGPEKSFYQKCIANCEKTPDSSQRVRSMEYPAQYHSGNQEEEPYIKNHIKWNDQEGTSPINESSHIFLFEYENHRILFCGDAGKEALTNAIQYAITNKIDLSNLNIIKMPHHGSRKNVNPQLMTQLCGQNTNCLFSCAPNDEGHHPSK